MIDKTKPATAIPLPVNCVGFLFTCEIATLEKMIPNNPNKGPQQNSDRIPITKPVTAIPFIFRIAPSQCQHRREYFSLQMKSSVDLVQ